MSYPFFQKSLTALFFASAGLLSACNSGPYFNSQKELGTSETKDIVEYEFLRNATARLSYNNKTFLLDPMLSNKGELPSFAGISPNPTVELPTNVSSIVAGIDGVIVGHMHADHFDQAAADSLPKNIPILTPKNSAPVNPADLNSNSSFKDQLEKYGFTNVTELDGTMIWQDVEFTQVWGRHGNGAVANFMGGVNGLIIKAESAPTIYWTGDTVIGSNKEAVGIVRKYEPEIIIAHTGGPVVPALSKDILLMDSKEAKVFFDEATVIKPDVSIIAVHMDALDHSFSTRGDLIDALGTEYTSGKVKVPTDGEVIRLK